MTEVIRGGSSPYFEAKGEWRRFGKFLISPKRLPDAPLTLGHFVYPPGARSHSHCHPFATEVYYCLSGTLDAIVSEKVYRLYAGDLIVISPGETHYATNPEEHEVQFVAIHTPPVSDYDVFTRDWLEREPELSSPKLGGTVTLAGDHD